MTWVWGKGGFKDITGTTPFVAGIYIEEQKEGEIYGSANCRAFGGGWAAEPPVGRVDDDLDAGENSRLPVVTGQKKSDG
jgi:hypothetical protein